MRRLERRYKVWRREDLACHAGRGLANAVRAAEGVHLRNLGRQAVTGRVATSADVTNAWANAGVIDLT